GVVVSTRGHLAPFEPPRDLPCRKDRRSPDPDQRVSATDHIRAAGKYRHRGCGSVCWSSPYRGHDCKNEPRQDPGSRPTVRSVLCHRRYYTSWMHRKLGSDHFCPKAHALSAALISQRRVDRAVLALWRA